MITKEPTEAMRRRAKKLARRWDMDVRDVLTCIVFEVSLKSFLRECGLPLETLRQIKLVNVNGKLCLDERPLNDIDPIKMMEVRAQIGNRTGLRP